MDEYGAIERGHENHGTGQGENLKVFEKTWGHRLLMGLSICMFVGGVILTIYCGMRLYGVSALVEGNSGYAIAFAIYLTGLIMGIAVIIPAIFGVFAASHPRFATAAIAAAILALAIDIAFVVYAATIGGQAFSIALYAVLLAIAPVLYLVAAAKIKRS